uniref:Macro domain-containing protein n=1 Tax=Gasterosteus aculeatus aculeatus TaxID=481459 RepID=G3Q5S8_GASAC
MDEYKHALFFEAKDLKDKEKGKIRRYFQIRRESGGGDCGMIEETEGDTYKICFKEKEDQERVLLRKFHTISLPRGKVRLTVSRAMPSQSDEPSSSSSSQTFPKPNTKCLEMIFPLNLFLLCFLRDNPKANKVLQKRLFCIGCTVELDFETEAAVVRGDIEKAPGGAFGVAEKWELQVDRVFTGVNETYCCYTAVEPKEVKILQQDPSFVTDDIKVYSESGYVVVVGEVEAVNERISMVKKSMPTRKELPIGERQFKLVQEEFSREVCVYYPEVKILIERNTITLEGPNMDVQSGATKLEELMKKVKEKRVKLCPALMSFIKSSDVIPKYEARLQRSLRNPVSLEAGSDLLLSSLSSDALDEAEVAVRRDLAEENLPAQGAAAAPPDLDTVKEILNKAKNEANSGEFRVDVSFIPGPVGTAAAEVRLVGYKKDVKKLKEVLHEYQMNQVRTQEVLKLPHPELLNCLNEFVNLIGMKQIEVTLTTSSYPYPNVLVAGPYYLVQETQQALRSALVCLVVDTLVLDGPGAQRYFKAEGRVAKELVESSCQVLIREQQSLQSPWPLVLHGTRSPVSAAPRPVHGLRSMAAGSLAVNKPSLEIKLGSLEDQQGNVLVVPMLNRKLTSTKIGKRLLTKAGNEIQWKFDLMAATVALYPGDVLQVDAPPSLGCSKLFFVECLPWDGVSGRSVQVLSAGLKKCLDLCVQQGLCSVAFPIIGHGIVLKYPPKEAVQVLTDNIQQFGLTASAGSLSTIHIVIKPDYPDSEKCYYEVYRHLSSSMNQGGHAIFKSLTSDLDDLTMTVGGGVKLKLVFGDITKETTDAVVNTTDFTNFQNSVCRAILTAAGPTVEAELKAGKVSRGNVLVSGPGLLPSLAIFHVSGEKDVKLIEQLVLRIVENCQAFWFRSVAIPAISAGAAGLDPHLVAGAILRGVRKATSSTLACLTDIRIVLSKMKVFLAFKEEALQMFSSAVIDRVSVPPSPRAQPGQQAPPSESADLSGLCTRSAGQQSVFLFLGLSRVDVHDAMTKLKDVYHAQCSTKTFKEEELAGLTQDNIEDLKQLVELEGLYVQREQPDRGTLAVSGLKDGVNTVMQMINASLQDSLRREVRVREEEDLFNRVAWCIQPHGGNWERLPKTANHNLENNRVAGGITDAQNTKWSVDPRRTEATNRSTGQTAKLKRLEHLSDFTFPLYWDNMAAGEAFKKIPLQPSSAEYQTVKEGFLRTVQKTVMKHRTAHP